MKTPRRIRLRWLARVALCGLSLNIFSALAPQINRVFTDEAWALTYAAYRPWAQGSARIVSLGGAFAAVGDDPSNMWISPAMIPLTGTGVDVVLTSGQAFTSDYQGLYTANTQKTFRASFNTLSLSLASSKGWSLGIGQGDPFNEGPDNPAFGGSSLTLHETRISFGGRIFEKLGTALTLVNRTITERVGGYTVNAIPATLEQNEQKVTWGLSVAYAFGPTEYGDETQNSAPWKVSTSWEQGAGFDTLRAPIGTSILANGLQPVRIPDVTRFGFSRTWSEIKLMVTAECDMWTNTANLSGFIDSQNATQLTNSRDAALFVPRVGLEHQLLERNWIKSWVRGGFYIEPPRVEEDRSREHWTLGVESKLWIIDVNFAFDHASGYTNAATSLGISLSDYL